jgi:aryl-alcohol dehydrogenase-like predicted oxidoreductase
MRYRFLSSSVLQVSELSYGSWLTIGDHRDAMFRASDLMTVAYDAGINFFDNAEVYGHGPSEEVMGDVLAQKGWSRDSYIVSSQAFFGCPQDPRPNQNGLSRKHFFEACHQALRRLHVDYLDLYYCHRPDPRVQMAEIVPTMSDLVSQGKLFYLGTGEWPGDLFRLAHKRAQQINAVPPVVEQPQYSLVVRNRAEREYKPLCHDLGMELTTWSPLASGLLTGKCQQEIPTDSRFGQSPWLCDLREENHVNGMPRNKLHQVDLNPCPSQGDGFSTISLCSGMVSMQYASKCIR